MSIHELVYDQKGRIIQSRCVDKEIESPQNFLNGTPSLQESYSLRGDSEINLKFPFTTREVKAESVDLVRVRRWLRGWTEEGNYVSMPIPGTVYHKEQINQHLEDLRVGDRGFGYSETEIFVAPKKPRPGIIRRLKRLLRAANLRKIWF